MSIHSSPPPRQCLSFLLCVCVLYPASLLSQLCPGQLRAPPWLPGHRAHSSTERSRQNLAEWVNCVCLLPPPSLGSRVELAWVALSDPQKMQVGCGSWLPAPFTFRILSSGWDHLPPPALGQEEKPILGHHCSSPPAHLPGTGIIAAVKEGGLLRIFR